MWFFDWETRESIHREVQPMKFRSHGGMLLTFLMMAALLLASGCVSYHDSYIPPPVRVPSDNSIVINKSKDQVWKGIIPALGGSFYVINNVDKESGLINVSFNADPGKYIDCGQIHYDITNPQGRRDYDFPGAIKDTQYEYIVPRLGLIRFSRKMQLEGRINFIVQELGPQSTRVTANVKYVITRGLTAVDVYGRQESVSEAISFGSNQREKFSGQSPTICQSSGAFERDLLELIRKAL
jgi:hypothetical protein